MRMQSNVFIAAASVQTIHMGITGKVEQCIVICQ